MKKINLIIVITLVQILISCNTKNNQKDTTKAGLLDPPIGTVLYKTEDLIIKKTANNVYEHISYFYSNDLGKIPVTGMIVVHNKEAIVFNTPSSEQISEKLIKCITEKMQCKINAIVVTSIHPQCLAGLKSFHRNNIVSYASNRTIALAKREKYTEPQLRLNNINILNVGNKKVHIESFKETPVKGSLIENFPEDKVIFDGKIVRRNEDLINNMKGTNSGQLFRGNTKNEIPELSSSALLDDTVDLL